jgi:two-component system chemotaxis sensor kinase CheA
MGKNIDVDQELLCSFVDDVLDALQGFEKSILALRTQPYDHALEDLFRTAHNIKGASMCIGLESLGDFIHSVEDVIQCMINGVVTPDEQVISSLLAAQSCMTTWARTLLSNPSYTPAMGPILKDLRAVGSERMLGARGKSSTTSGSDGASGAGVDASGEEEDLDALFKMHRKIYQQQRGAQAAATTSQAAKNEDSARESKSEDDSHHGKSKPGAQSRLHETLRISAHKLDELIQLMSELSIHQGIIQEARKNQDLQGKSSAHAIQLSQKLVKEIHSRAIELRMQPLSGLLQKLERNAMDLALMQGKQVNVIIEGGDVQLDKSVIEKISDPLVHVIRNSVDHGIEAPSRRVALGKPAEATIKLTAHQDAVGVSILVSDDGQGMDDEVIFAAAVKKGIVKPDAQLTSDQIRRLIFIQGLSTASKLTEISGRGVGMDIVMRTVQSLRGRIDLHSTIGKGTSISFTLPTSLSIIDALVVKVNEARYAVPMHELTEIIDLSSYPIESTGQGGFMISLRGEVVPVETLADYMPTPGFLGSTPAAINARGQSSCPALLVRDGFQSIAFAIDKVVSQQQVVVRPLSEQLDGLQGFRGCTILGDGEPGVILSLPELARTYFSSVGDGGGTVS